MKKTILLAASLLMSLNGFAAASASSDAVKINRGAAKSFYCTGCHGYNGMGTKGASELAGRDADELTNKLIKFKKTKSKLKQNLLARFSEEDMAEVGAYFASLKKTPRDQASFERDITPILTMRCVECHSGEGEGAHTSGLNLANHGSLMSGTKEGGQLIVPGSAMTSSFMVMLTRKDHLRMPYGKSPLSDDEVRVIRKWIDQGAKNN
ncbi:c-type cytochrome [Pseudomonadota bacterium]